VEDTLFNLKAIAVATSLVFAGSAASALCTIPNIDGSDTIVKYGTTLSSESLGAMGTKDTLSARSAGSTYYDHASSTLKICDGTYWRDVVTKPGSTKKSAFEVGDIYSVDFETWTSAPDTTKIPISAADTYRLDFRLYPLTSETCYFQWLNTEGEWKDFAVTDNNEVIWAGITLTPRISKDFSFTRTFDFYSPLAPDEQPEASANAHGAYNLFSAGVFNWEGKIKVKPLKKCGGGVKVIRMQ
jgi:hypothetical protein